MSDASGALSLDEFLAGPNDRAEGRITDEQKAKMIGKMTTDFNSYADEDGLLSGDELAILLKEVALRNFSMPCSLLGSCKHFGNLVWPEY